MYLAKAVSTWDNLSYQAFITGHNAELVYNWEKATVSSNLFLPHLATCCFPAMRQATTSEAKWILADLKMSKVVSERPITAFTEEILDVKRIAKTYDMRIMDDDQFKLIGMEKDGQPNLSPAGPGPYWTDAGRARFLTFHLIMLANPEKKLSIVNESYPLAANMEEIINFREAFFNRRVRDINERGFSQLRDAATGHHLTTYRRPPATSTPNTSGTAPPLFDCNNESADNNQDARASTPDSQLFFTMEEQPEEIQGEGNGEKEETT